MAERPGGLSEVTGHKGLGAGAATVAPLMQPENIVARKEAGGELSGGELAALVHGFLEGGVGEDTMAAFLRAGVREGFSDAEAVGLTEALLATGETLDLSALGPEVVDKHSTGGVGDTTTLLVAPMLAAAGVRLVKLAGRSLGHTGGTIDKLEAIPGLRTDLSPDELVSVARQAGCVVAEQSARLAPGDKALYALRDATGTVADPALIASSVMSKKLAAGAGTIVLDVKAGEGAFMGGIAEASALGGLCVRIGQASGRRMTALVTAMDQPLGRAVGNAVEVTEAVTLLAAPPSGRLAEVAIELAANALALAREQEIDAARREVTGCWADGRALDRLQAMVAAQGGDPAVCERPHRVLPQAPTTRLVTGHHAGTVRAVSARGVGEVAMMLGAKHDPSVGVRLSVEVGDRVGEGDELARVYARSEDEAAQAGEALAELVTVTDEPVGRPPAILDTVTA